MPLLVSGAEIRPAAAMVIIVIVIIICRAALGICIRFLIIRIQGPEWGRRAISSFIVVVIVVVAGLLVKKVKLVACVCVRVANMSPHAPPARSMASSTLC